MRIKVVEEPLVTVMLTAFCDCGGEVKTIGQTQSIPVIFQVQCTKCEKTGMSRQQLPAIVHRKADEENESPIVTL